MATANEQVEVGFKNINWILPVPIPSDERLELVGRLEIGTVVVSVGLLTDVALDVVARLPLLRLLTYGRLIWIVVGIVLETVLLGDDPGLLNPFVGGGVGVVEGDAEYRLGKSRLLPGMYGSMPFAGIGSVSRLQKCSSRFCRTVFASFCRRRHQEQISKQFLLNDQLITGKRSRSRVVESLRRKVRNQNEKASAFEEKEKRSFHQLYSSRR